MGMTDAAGNALLPGAIRLLFGMIAMYPVGLTTQEGWMKNGPKARIGRRPTPVR